MKMIRSFVLLSLGCTLAASAHAEDLAEQVARCGALESNLRRLECFDELAHSVTPVTPSRLPTPLPAKPQVVGTVAPPEPSLRQATMQSKSFVPLLKKKIRPQLIIECRPTFWQASVMFGEKIGHGPHTVSTRFDGGAILSGDWQLTRDGQGLIVPEAETLARVALKQNTFEMKVVGREIPVLRFSFDVQAARSQLRRLREQCG